MDLVKNTCSCFQFQSQGYPCAHAFNVLLYRRETYVNYIESWLKVTAYHKTYKNSILPPTAAIDLDEIKQFEQTETWKAARELDDDNIEFPEALNDSENDLMPPNTRRPAGRPKKRRIRHPTEHEPVRILCCRRCGGDNHNKRTCREPLQAPAQAQVARRG